MIAWLKRLLTNPKPDPSPDIDTFIDRTRAHRADAIREQKASVEVTRKLRSNFLEQDLLNRLHERGSRNA